MMDLATRLEEGADDQGKGVVQEAADTLREQCVEIRLLRAAVGDLLCGWRYIRQSHGDLYGVGWVRAQEKAELALGIEPGAAVPQDCFPAVAAPVLGAA